MLAPFHGAEAIGEGDGAAKVVIVRIGPAAGLTGSAQHDFTAEAHIVGVDALRHIVPEDHRAGAVIEGVNGLSACPGPRSGIDGLFGALQIAVIDE